MSNNKPQFLTQLRAIHFAGNDWYRVDVLQGKYMQNGALALMLEQEGQPLAAVSVNLAEQPAEGCIWVKNYGENEGVQEAMIAAGVIELTGRSKRAGFIVCDEARIKMTPFEDEEKKASPAEVKEELEGPHSFGLIPTNFESAKAVWEATPHTPPNPVDLKEILTFVDGEILLTREASEFEGILFERFLISARGNHGSVTFARFEKKTPVEKAMLAVHSPGTMSGVLLVEFEGTPEEAHEWISDREGRWSEDLGTDGAVLLGEWTADYYAAGTVVGMDSPSHMLICKDLAEHRGEPEVNPC